MTDIVERLRHAAHDSSNTHLSCLEEAADTIEALQSALRERDAECERLRAENADLSNYKENAGDQLKMFADDLNKREDECERLRGAAKSACFHYWNCSNDCPEAKRSMALLARAINYSDPATNDELEQAIRTKEGG